MVTNNSINLEDEGIAYYDGTSSFSPAPITENSIVIGAANNNIKAATALTDGQLIIGSTGLEPAVLSIGTARQILQVNSGSTNIEWASNIDIPGTLDVTGLLIADASATILTAGTPLNLGTDISADAINIGTGAAARVITVGNVTGASQLVLNSGTGGIRLASTGTGDITIDSDDTLTLESDGIMKIDTAAVIQIGIDDVASAQNLFIGSNTSNRTLLLRGGTAGIMMDSAGSIEINSSAGAISIGNDAVAQNINIGTGAAARTITIGNTISTTGLLLNSGTGGIRLASTGTGDITIDSDDTLTLESDGIMKIDTAAVIQIGIDDVASAQNLFIGSNTSNRTLLLRGGTAGIMMDSAGSIEINSSAGAISIGNDAIAQNINIGIGAATRVITIGNISSASQVVLNSGTGGIQLTSRGSGDITIDSDDTLLLDSDGVLEINSSAGAISIGNDAVALSVNVATGAAAMTTILGSTNTTSSTTIQAGSGEVAISAAGAVSMVPSTSSVADISLTINARVGVATFTAQTTAAGANIDLTILNSSLGAGDGVFCTVSNLGAADADITLEGCITTTAGTLLLRCQNNGTAALNGDIVVTFWIIN